MSEQTAETDRKHHPDCPAPHFPERTDRCRCMFLAVLDRPSRTGARLHCTFCGERGHLNTPCPSSPTGQAGDQ